MVSVSIMIANSVCNYCLCLMICHSLATKDFLVNTEGLCVALNETQKDFLCGSRRRQRRRWRPLLFPCIIFLNQLMNFDKTCIDTFWEEGKT